MAKATIVNERQVSKVKLEALIQPATSSFTPPFWLPHWFEAFFLVISACLHACAFRVHCQFEVLSYF